MRPCVGGIDLGRALDEVQRSVVVLRVPCRDVRHGTDDTPPRVEAFRCLALETKGLSSVKLRLDGGHDTRGYLVLYRKHIGNGPVIALSPDVGAGGGIDKLSADAQALARFANAAF